MRILRTATVAILAVASCLAINHASAQTQLAGWNVNGLPDGAGGAPPALFAATSFATNYVTAGNLSKSTNPPGIGTVATEDEAYGGNAWYSTSESESNSITNGLFIQYSIAANPGYLISFSTNFLNYHNSATGPTNGALQYSTDGVNFSNIALISYANYDTSATSTNIINLSTNAFLQNVPSGTTNYFRIVNWGTDGTGTSGTWYIYNTVPANAGLQLIGSVQTELAGWNVNSVPEGAGGAPPADFAATTVAANVAASDLTKSTIPPGILVEATEDAAYGGNGWTNTGFLDTEANSIANGLFIQYSVEAEAGFAMSFNENFLNFHTSSTGPSMGALQYCTDGVSYSNIATIAYGGGGGTTTVTGTNIINLATNAFLQNVPSGTTNFFRLVNWGATSAGGTWYIYNSDTANAGLQLIGALTSSGTIAPTNLAVTPLDVTTNAGSTVDFTVTANGSTPTYAWYAGAPGSGTPVTGATNAILTLPGVLGGNSGRYFVVLSNAAGMATSSVVTLTVTGDPGIIIPPNSAFGLLDGAVQFTVAAAATSPSYYWYQSNALSSSYTLVTNGLQSSGSTVSGASTSTLTISDLQSGDTNAFAGLEVLVSNAFGTAPSAPVSLLAVSSTTATLAFWDFNGADFTNVALIPYPNTGLGTSLLNPPPYYGVGTASAVGTCFDPGTSPFSGSVDPEDGAGTPYPQDGQAQGLNFSWGTDNYPLTGGNKQNGVQFMVSTVGAKNISVSYDSRTSATASGYERLQYTTNGGSEWIDYPTSSTFGGTATTYKNFAYSLTGFPGTANNPDFGIQVVTEYQSTATYGIGTQGGLPNGLTNGYVGTDNTYGTTGTVTYDIVFINGQAITNTYSPPTISPISYIAGNGQAVVITNGVTNLDYIPLTNTFTIGSAFTPVSLLTVSAQSLNPNKVNPGFGFSIVGSNVTMIISPFSIQDTYDAAPILVTVTDTNGDSTVAYYLLTLQSLNLPPTNTLASLISTNVLANSSLSIPFFIGSYDGTNTSPPVTFSSNSVNNTVLPAANIVITGEGTTNPTVTLTPATNQLGIAPLSISVDDGNPLEPKTTTANIALMVRPNTNVVLIDYFNYDNAGALDAIPGGIWSHLSGPTGQMQQQQSAPDTVTVDTLNNTENLQAALLGAPYYVNSAASNTAPVLYASFLVSMNNGAALPLTNGTYFALFNDGSGVTGNYNCGVWISTNGAALGNYRLGIVNFPSAEGDGFVLFPQDLAPHSNYIVVAALTLSNSFSTLWVNPLSSSSQSVSDNTTASGIGATNFNIKDFELRESGALGGTVTVSKLKVGTTFDSVLPSLHIQEAGTNVVLTWSDPTLGIQSAPDLLSPWTDVLGATSPYTNAVGTNTETYFRFGQ